VCVCVQGVDIFAKDWLFIPYHDYLHWSLILVAHPGVLPGDDPQRAQCIVHFDSMGAVRFLPPPPPPPRPPAPPGIC